MSEYRDTGSSGAADDAPRTALPKIGQPATRALANAGYTRLEQLTAVTPADLLALHGVGPRAIQLLREALTAQGLHFAGEE